MVAAELIFITVHVRHTIIFIIIIIINFQNFLIQLGKGNVINMHSI